MPVTSAIYLQVVGFSRELATGVPYTDSSQMLPVPSVYRHRNRHAYLVDTSHRKCGPGRHRLCCFAENPLVGW
ncbi:hypothetical protein TcWFU_008893 [Taenia crassiceps]|uniref:Uncharacterized protein n=1 Tax=Taenia crassiceps TaxID=6207 RepID=A0ABR4QT02_9CEST